MEQAIWREDGTVLVRGMSVLVALSPDRATPMSVPDRWRRVIADWEQQELEDARG